MNCRYFTCNDHRRYADAGYRWAYWELENKGVVRLEQPVDVDAVLKHDSYWHPSQSEQSDWLVGALANVRTFLEEHRNDTILYVDEEFLTKQWELGYEWRELTAIGKSEQNGAGNGGSAPAATQPDGPAAPGL